PRGYKETGIGYPVVYVLYADHTYLYYGEAIHDLTLFGLDLMPETIVVGIVNVQRYRDLMPVGPEGSPESIDRFLRFMQEELFPFIEDEYRTKGFRILIGPQAGACFGIYSIIESPRMFNAFILNNPFRNPDVMEYLLEPFEQTLERGKLPRTWLSIVTRQSESPRALEGIRTLKNILSDRAPDNLQWQVAIQETPAFLEPLGIDDALLEIFSRYPFPAAAEVNNLSDIMEHYQGLSDLYGFPIDPSDQVLALQSDQLADRGMYDSALEVLHQLIETYPHSMNGYLRLGLVNAAKGDTTRAIHYFEECLRRDPYITPARDWLTRLLPPPED
ncbi:tetratricopeptide repeat protein, partial [Candidatus Zixiibacteriota bacterium]